MEFKDYLRDLGESVGIPELSADENGCCNLEIDGMDIRLSVAPIHNVLLIRGQVMPLPQDVGTAFLKQVLKLNFLFEGTRGATLALNPENDNLELLKEIAEFSSRSSKAISDALAEFVNGLEDIRNTMLEYRPDHQDSSSATPNDWLLSNGLSQNRV